MEGGETGAALENLTVTFPPAPGSTPPIRIESSSSHVAEGQTLDLKCVVQGQAHAQVTWHKRGGSLPARHQVEDTGIKEPRRGIVGLENWCCGPLHSVCPTVARTKAYPGPA